jgi:cytochrome c6
MKKSFVLATVVLSVGMMSAVSFAADGAAIFKEKCASCHPDGGNIMKPSETLKGKSAKSISKKVRKGGGGMPAFDAKAISDADLKALADYTSKTFKK